MAFLTFFAPSPKFRRRSPGSGVEQPTQRLPQQPCLCGRPSRPASLWPPSVDPAALYHNPEDWACPLVALGGLGPAPSFVVPHGVAAPPPRVDTTTPCLPLVAHSCTKIPSWRSWSSGGSKHRLNVGKCVPNKGLCFMRLEHLPSIALATIPSAVTITQSSSISEFIEF